MTAIEQAEKIYSVCMQAAKEGKTLNYRDVLNKLGYGPKVGGHVIRYGLELAWMACAYKGLPSLTAIVVNKSTGAPSEGYAVVDWQKDKQAVFAVQSWPIADSIDWTFIWENRVELSEKYGTRGYWMRS